jgi:DNA-binding LacI/PurR family transcriptional regulator
MAKPTINDVADRAGVSKSLVSLVIRGSSSVSDERRKAVERAVVELGYRPNGVARSLKERRTRTVGVVIWEMRNPWFVELVEHFQRAMSEREMTVLIGNGHLGTGTNESLVEAFLTMRVDGLLLIGPPLMSSTILSAAASVPTVVSVTREVKAPRVDVATNDDYAGSRLAVKHLADMGHRRIAYLGNGDSAVCLARMTGYRDEMANQRIAKEDRVQWCDFTEPEGYQAALQLLRAKRPPTAIVGVNDSASIGALAAADALGIDVPEQLSIVGYDNSLMASIRRISLTTIDPRNGEIGRVAAELMLERIKQPRRPATERVIAPTLVVRGTSGPARANSQER